MPADINKELAAAKARIRVLEQQLQDSEVYLRYFIQQSPVSVAMFDTGMHYLAVSDKYLQDYQVKDSILGKNHYEIFPQVPDRWKAVHMRCLKGVEESCVEDRFPQPNGEIYYIDWVTKPWYHDDGQIGGLLLFAEVVNDRVEAKQKLLKSNQALKQHNQKMQEFTYVISHYLKEPLQAAINYAEKLHQSQPISDVGVRLLTLTRRMRHMLGSLLHGMKSELADKVKDARHLISVNEVLDTAIETLDPLIQSRKARVLYGTLPQVQANEIELVALFQNLIANGILYNHHEPIEVIIAVEQVEESWRFSVRDNGDGIPAERQVGLFDQMRGWERGEPEEVNGIGLPLCKRIVKNLGGDMWLESEVGVGTQIFFTLPVTLADT